jgi:hypothetical protein
MTGFYDFLLLHHKLINSAQNNATKIFKGFEDLPKLLMKKS